MSISKLIKDQNIQIDNHKSGAEIRCNDTGLHIHKRMNHHSNYGGVNIRIPLNGNESIDFSNFKGGKDIEKRLRREIVDALSNKTKVRSFVTDFLSWIKGNGQNNRINREEIIDSAKKAIETLRKHFDSYPSVEHHFTVIGDEVIGHFWPTENNGFDRELYIKADTQNSRLRVARESRYI